MKKIKILRIIARLNIGGPAIQTILLTEGIDKSRFSSLLISGNIGKDEADMSYYAIRKNVKPIVIPELKRELSFFNDIIAFKKIYNIIRTEKPDIIHTHTAKAGALGRLGGILYNFFTPYSQRIKLIHTFHGHVFSGYFNIFKSSLFIFIERFLAFFTYRVITVSESIKDELIILRICQEDKIKVIHLGLELDKLLDIPVRDNSILNISIIARLVPIKNHHLFLRAAADVIKANPDMQLRFKIIGDGPLRLELEKYACRLNINTQVIFLGWQKDPVHIYSESDIVALTSINEGTPVSLIEGMAAGKAIVATDVGGVRNLLGCEMDIGIKPNADFKVLERGIIVKTQDVFSFANALIFLLKDNKFRKNMGMVSRDFVKMRFTKDRLIKDMESLYNSILI